MSLLTMIQNAAAIIGLQVPSVVALSQDQNVQQLLALAQIEGVSLTRQHNWSQLVQEATLTTIAAEDQGPVTTVIGADYDRLVPDTAWDRSLIRPLPGPRSPQAWAQDHALVAAGPFYGFRIYADHFWVFPIPDAGRRFTVEYISNAFCQDAAGNRQTRWIADTDTGILDETLMALGLFRA